MLLKVWIMACALMLTCALHTQAQQRLQEREEEFLKARPLVDDPLPDVTISTPDGTPFKTGDLRGHYTVLTFGCLTCPPSMWNIPGMEAVYQDYKPKGVKFYFVFKSLAHPELSGNLVQPFTQKERLAQAQQAVTQFGTKTPWIVDDIDNRFKHAMGDRPNSQFVINPEGIIVRKRAWANPRLVRKDLEDLVGPVEKITTEEEIELSLGKPLKQAGSRGVMPRFSRLQMLPIVVEPELKEGAQPFYGKLRAEADGDLISKGTGKLYLGFHLDPLYAVSWNNLANPLSYSIEQIDGFEADKYQQSAPLISEPSDADPREFMVHVQTWKADVPLKLTVKYFVCEDKETCYALTQKYIIRLQRDIDGGGARSEGAGLWNRDDFALQLMKSDKDQDRKLSRKEAPGIASPHFDKLDANDDGFLELEELKSLADWLNHRHRPGAPAKRATRVKEDDIETKSP